MLDTTGSLESFSSDEQSAKESVHEDKRKTRNPRKTIVYQYSSDDESNQGNEKPQSQRRKPKKKKRKKVYDRHDISKWPECLLYLLPIADMATSDIEQYTDTFKEPRKQPDSCPSSDYGSHSAEGKDSDLNDLSR